MTAAEIIAELKPLGSDSYKKTLMNHGVKEPFYGVKIGDMKRVQKKVKKDYQLALDLYDTGIHDWMYLAGLIADDHQMITDGLCSLLQEHVDLVGTVRDGRALLDAVQELRPDVVVTDISMPLLNGLDAVRQLRRQPSPPRVIFLTMHPAVKQRDKVHRTGAI